MRLLLQKKNIKLKDLGYSLDVERSRCDDLARKLDAKDEMF